MQRPLLLCAIALMSLAARAAEPVQILIKSQAFVPQEIQVPAGEKVQLVVVNQDAVPAEFESYDLSREIVVPAHGQVKLYIGPLDPGRYRFFNDFHQASEGWVVATAAAK
ncbi:MAG: cupredoxin domain-containing protein [Bacillota bacterium]